jgi:hypothetical protein
MSLDRKSRVGLPRQMAYFGLGNMVGKRHRSNTIHEDRRVIPEAMPESIANTTLTQLHLSWYLPACSSFW